MIGSVRPHLQTWEDRKKEYGKNADRENANGENAYGEVPISAFLLRRAGESPRIGETSEQVNAD